MKILKSFALVLMFLVATNVLAQDMNNEHLERIIRKLGHSVEGQSGYWQMQYRDRFLMTITDEGHNRMRIITPIIEVKKLKKKTLLAAMNANFHTVLDVKYAISDGTIWSIFVHPLKELSREQVEDAYAQVYMAAATFGGSFSSTDLEFPGGAE